MILNSHSIKRIKAITKRTLIKAPIPQPPEISPRTHRIINTRITIQIKLKVALLLRGGTGFNNLNLDA
jgi:hypothetical protein